MASETKASIDDSDVRALFARMKAQMPEVIDGAMDKTAEQIKLILGGAANKGVTGVLGNDIEIKSATNERYITPTAPHAPFVEYGTRPHFPPAYENSPLALWAESKGMEPFAVAKSISRRGTKAHPFIEPTRQKVPALFYAIMDAEISKFVGSL